MPALQNPNGFLGGSSTPNAGTPNYSNSSYNPAAPTAAAGASYTQYDSTQPAATNAQNMVANQNQNYQSFLANMPTYQANLQNQAIDQGASSYNNAKQNIDTQSNQRGLLYSGLKQGAEAGAATNAANQTQNAIASGNANLANYATGYGNQVAQSNIANQQGNVLAALQQYGQNMQQQAQQSQQTGSLLGGAAAIGGAALFSDKKLKDNIKNADDDANEMISKLKSKSFSYKDDPDKKEQLGILAQDLEKSPMGKSIVIETPKGKAIDMAKALSAVLAVQSVLDKRLKRVSA